MVKVVRRIRAGGELSGGVVPATLRVHSVLLHYLPPKSSKYLNRGVMSLEQHYGNVIREPRAVARWLHEFVPLSLVWVSVDGNIL